MFISELDYIDYHVSCEPFRLLVEPWTNLKGKTQMEVRSDFQKRYSDVRKRLLREPRGHSDNYGGIITPPVNEGSLFGILFMFSTGMSPLCGHGAIAVARAAVDLGYIENTNGHHEFFFDAPVGQVRAFVEIENERIIRSGFDNTESYCVDLDVPIEVEGYGTVHVNVGYGGAFMVFADEKAFGIDILSAPLEQMIDIGMKCKEAFYQQANYIHPINGMETSKEGICMILEKEPEITGNTVYHHNFTVFGNRQYDRSPTGTGSSALAAILYKKGILKPGMTLENRGYLNLPFYIKITPADNGDIEGSVIPTVSSNAYMIAKGTSLLEDDDPLPKGYTDRGDML